MFEVATSLYGKDLEHSLKIYAISLKIEER